MCVEWLLSVLSSCHFLARQSLLQQSAPAHFCLELSLNTETYLTRPWGINHPWPVALRQRLTIGDR